MKIIDESGFTADTRKGEAYEDTNTYAPYTVERTYNHFSTVVTIDMDIPQKYDEHQYQNKNLMDLIREIYPELPNQKNFMAMIHVPTDSDSDAFDNLEAANHSPVLVFLFANPITVALNPYKLLATLSKRLDETGSLPIHIIFLVSEGNRVGYLALKELVSYLNCEVESMVQRKSYERWEKLTSEIQKNIFNPYRRPVRDKA